MTSRQLPKAAPKLPPTLVKIQEAESKTLTSSGTDIRQSPTTLNNEANQQGSSKEKDAPSAINLEQVPDDNALSGKRASRASVLAGSKMGLVGKFSKRNSEQYDKRNSVADRSRTISFSLSSKNPLHIDWMVDPHSQLDLQQKALQEWAIACLEQASNLREDANTKPIHLEIPITMTRYYGDVGREQLLKLYKSKKMGKINRKISAEMGLGFITEKTLENVSQNRPDSNSEDAESKEKFLIQHVDGSTTVYYQKTGHIAILVSSVEDLPGRLYVNCYDNDKARTCLAAFTPYGKSCCYHRNGVPGLVLSEYEGVLKDEDGNVLKRWDWEKGKILAKLNIVVTLNKEMYVRVLSKWKIFLYFNSHKEGIKIPVAAHPGDFGCRRCEDGTQMNELLTPTKRREAGWKLAKAIGDEFPIENWLKLYRNTIGVNPLVIKHLLAKVQSEQRVIQTAKERKSTFSVNTEVDEHDATFQSFRSPSAPPYRQSLHTNDDNRKMSHAPPRHEVSSQNSLHANDDIRKMSHAPAKHGVPSGNSLLPIDDDREMSYAPPRHGVSKRNSSHVNDDIRKSSSASTRHRGVSSRNSSNASDDFHYYATESKDEFLLPPYVSTEEIKHHGQHSILTLPSEHVETKPIDPVSNYNETRCGCFSSKSLYARNRSRDGHSRSLKLNLSHHLACHSQPGLLNKRRLESCDYCPAVVRNKILYKDYKAVEKTLISCRCSNHRIPFIHDLEFDCFLRKFLPDKQLVIINIMNSLYPEANVYETMLARVYFDKNRNRSKPCKESERDQYRLLRYDLAVAKLGTDCPAPLLLGRHNVVPGMTMIYCGGHLLFADHIFNGYGNALKDFRKQIYQTQQEGLLGHYLPDNFKFSPARGKPGTRVAWGGEIGGTGINKKGLAGLYFDHPIPIPDSETVFDEKNRKSSLGTTTSDTFPETNSNVTPPAATTMPASKFYNTAGDFVRFSLSTKNYMSPQVHRGFRMKYQFVRVGEKILSDCSSIGSPVSATAYTLPIIPLRVPIVK